MALQIYFNTGDDANDGNIFGVNQKGQTFTTVGAFTINQVKLKLLTGAGSTNITAYLYLADAAHKPTGGILATSDTLSSGGFGADPGSWQTFTFGTPYALSATTEYAIVLTAPAGDGSNYVGWRGDVAGGYAGGYYLSSGDSGASWGTSAADDFMFETYSLDTSAVVLSNLSLLGAG